MHLCNCPPGLAFSATLLIHAAHVFIQFHPGTNDLGSVHAGFRTLVFVRPQRRFPISLCQCIRRTRLLRFYVF